MCIRAHCLVLAVDQDPQSYLILRVVEMLCNPRFESTVGLVLENTEGRQVRRWPVAIVEACQVKAIVLSKRIVGNNLWRP